MTQITLRGTQIPQIIKSYVDQHQKNGNCFNRSVKKYTVCEKYLQIQKIRMIVKVFRKFYLL